MADKIWKKFEKNLKLIVPNIDNSVLKKLKLSFLILPLNFLSSDNCNNLIKDTIDKISHNKVKLYIHLLDFKKSLKEAAKVGDERPTQSTKRRRVILEEVIEDDYVVNIKDEQKEFLDYYNASTSETKNVEKVDKKQSKIDEYILKLENILESTKVQIQKLEEDELSLDDLDLENNSFMMLDKLKAHSVKVWRKICKLRHTSSRLHRRQAKAFTFKGTVYSDLNTNIENFIKTKKFPDYHDIKSLVTEYSNEKSLNLNDRKVRELSLDIFTQVGNQLKKLRIRDFVNYFGNHLTDGVKDVENPILKSDDLKRVLIRSYNVGQLKLDEVLDRYTKIEQGYINKDEDVASCNSTEHSETSDNDIDEDLEEINIEDLRKQEIGEDSEEDEVEVEVDDTIDDHQHFTIDPEDLIPPISSKPCFVQLSPLQPVVEPVPENRSFSNNVTNSLLHNQYNGEGFSLISSTINIPQHDSEAFSLISNTFNMPREDAEAQINELQSHTFQFNIDQIKKGANGKIYPSTITLNSSDETDADSIDDVPDIEENTYAYSSKLDDFCVVKLKKKENIDTGICITIDDSDDDS